MGTAYLYCTSEKRCIIKTEFMIGKRTFPTRNKTQIIKKTNHCRWICILLHFLCVNYIYYEKMEGMEFPITTR